MKKILFGAELNGTSQMSKSPNYPELSAICKNVENLGFDSAWTMDHFTWGPNSAVFECWTILTALARDTKKIHLGSHFLCNSYRNPALVAKMAATLDIISNGRLELGMGAGWNKEEYTSYGYHFPNLAERVKSLDEAVTIIKLMWSGKPATFHGEYHNVTNAVCLPKPVQEGGPPIWIGGGGEKFTLRVVAKHADVCNFSGMSTTLEEFQRKMNVLEKHCTSVGRQFNDIIKSVTLEVVLGNSESDARQIEKKVPLSKSEFRFVGTPSQCNSLLQKYIDSGASYFILHIEDLLPSLDIFAQDVLPSFQ